MFRKSVVTIYVRHQLDCRHAANPVWPRCDCPKWLRYSGDICLCGHSHRGRQHRFSSNARSWAEAEEKRAEAQRRIDAGEAIPLPSAPQKTIAQAIETFILKKQGEQVTPETIQKIRQRLTLFERFLAARSRFLPSEITPDDVIEFRASWTLKSGVTRQKAQTTLKSFLKHACPHAETLRNALGKIKLSKEDDARLEPKPFTEQELKHLLAQVPKTFPDVHKAALVTALIHCQVATGLSIRDAWQLRRENLTQNHLGCWLNVNRQKTNKHVRQRIDKSLYDELMSVTNGSPKYIFWNGTSLPTTASHSWQADLRQVMKDAGLWIPGNLSHRFRDTAVDTWLELGWRIEDVAEALGDTVAVVEKHYKTLVSERSQARLAKLPVRSW
jgi:integrase